MPERKVSVEVEVTGSNKMRKGAGGGVGGVGTDAGGGGGGGGVPTVAAAGPSLFVANQMRSLGVEVAKLRDAIVSPPVPSAAGRAMGWMQGGVSKEQAAAAGTDLAVGLRQIGLGLGVAAAAASGFTASMSPMTFSTLTGSVQLLGNEFVKLLIPAFSMASLKIQQVTGWVASLDESTKGWISSTAMWVAPGMVALGVLGAMVPILRLVTGGVILLSTSLWTAGRAALAFVLTPWGAGLAAIAVTVGLLTNGFGLLGDSIERAGARADVTRERLQRLQQPGAQVTRADYESLDVNLRRIIERSPAAERGGLFGALLQQRQNELRRTQEMDPTRQAAIIEEALSRTAAGGNVPGQGFGQSRDARRRELIVDALAAEGLTRTAAMAAVAGLPSGALTGSTSILPGAPAVGSLTAEQIRIVAREVGSVNVETSQREQVELMTRLRAQGIPGVFEGLRQSTPMQAQMFASASDMWFSVVQEVASRGQIEQDILRAIMENTARQVALTEQQQNGGVAVAPIPQPGAAPP